MTKKKEDEVVGMTDPATLVGEVKDNPNMFTPEVEEKVFDQGRMFGIIQAINDSFGAVPKAIMLELIQMAARNPDLNVAQEYKKAELRLHKKITIDLIEALKSCL